MDELLQPFGKQLRLLQAKTANNQQNARGEPTQTQPQKWHYVTS